MLQALPPPDLQPEIVVTGTALPAPRAERSLHVDRLSEQELRSSAPQPLDGLLERLAGVQQFRRADSRSAHPTSQGLTLRALGGNAASRALVLLDGVPQADPFGGWIAWPSIGTLGLAEVRLIRGGGSVTAGPGALAGTLELSSSAAPAILGIAELGSRSSLAAEGLVAEQVGSGFLSVSGRAARSDGFTPILEPSRGSADRPAPYRNGSARFRWVAPITAGTELQASLSTFTDRRERGLAFTTNSTKGTDLSLRAVSRGALPWSGLVYVQSRNFESSFASAGPSRSAASRVSLQYDVPGDAVGWSAEIRPRLGRRIELRIGSDGRRMLGKSREYANYVANAPMRQREAGGETAHDGLFAELSRQDSGLTLTAAGRIDHWRIQDGRLVERNLSNGAVTTNQSYADRTGWRPTGRLGASLAIDEGLNIRGAAYAGWRLPTLNELFRPFRVGPDATAANPLLKPERLRGVEAGADWNADEWRASATFFSNRLIDPIANVTLGSGPGVFPGVGFVAPGGAYRQRQNLRAIDAAGVEASAGWSKGPWSLTGSASMTRARVRAGGLLNGRRPAQSPSLSASASAAWEGRAASAAMIVHYEGRRFEDDLNLQSLAPALTMDAAAGLPLRGRISLTARAENLFNQKRVAAVTGDGTRERSTPRTLWIGLRLAAPAR